LARATGTGLPSKFNANSSNVSIIYRFNTADIFSKGPAVAASLNVHAKAIFQCWVRRVIHIKKPPDESGGLSRITVL
jgi:hypothetical protein